MEEQPFTFEVIIVENGSSDGTFDIAQEFAQKRENVRVLQSDLGKGAANPHAAMLFFSMPLLLSPPRLVISSPRLMKPKNPLIAVKLLPR